MAEMSPPAQKADPGGQDDRPNGIVVATRSIAH